MNTSKYNTVPNDDVTLNGALVTMPNVFANRAMPKGPCRECEES